MRNEHRLDTARLFQHIRESKKKLVIRKAIQFVFDPHACLEHGLFRGFVFARDEREGIETLAKFPQASKRGCRVSTARIGPAQYVAALFSRSFEKTVKQKMDPDRVQHADDARGSIHRSAGG